MKKILMTLVMALLMAGVALAQDNNNKQGFRHDSDEMVQQFTEQMVSRYGLDDTQKASLLKVNKQYADKLPMMGGKRGGRPGGPRGNRQNGQQPCQGGCQPNGQNGQPDFQNGQPDFQGCQPGDFDQSSASSSQRPQRPSKEDLEKHKKEMETNRKAYNAEVKKIMTSKQYKQFTEDQEKHNKAPESK